MSSIFKFDIKHQNEYSRAELLARTFFGLIYIGIPHGICLMFIGIGSAFIRFFSFWVILFTGKMPESFYKFHLGFFRWGVRVYARLLNLVDGYPAFGMNASDDSTQVEFTYHQEYDRGMVLLVGLLGALLAFPHLICLYFMMIGVSFVSFIAFFTILFTGKYSDGMHSYVVSTLRWGFRLMLYLNFLKPGYPPFTGKPDEDLIGEHEVIDL